jgi:membrane-associated protease RseP (regulator of RpoE activity)
MVVPGSWQFRLFNIPVRVHFSFLLLALLLGLGVGNLILFLLWVAIVFFSILLHEFGHALISRYFGRSPSIELMWSGGVTASSRYSLLSYPKEIMVSFAGPLAGFLFGGLVFLISKLVGAIPNPYLNWFISQLLWVNIGWGVFNLIPIIPLDGGTIMRNLYHWFRSPYDDRTPYKISIGFGILTMIAAPLLLGRGGIYVTVVIGLLTFNNYSALRRGYWSDGIL